MRKIILATALLASGSVFAAGMPMSTMQPVATPSIVGWYIGAGVIDPGMWNQKNFASIHGTSGSWKQDNFPFGATAFAGYRLSQYFGAELNYSWLRALKYRNQNNHTQSYEYSQNNAVFADGYAYYPFLDNFEVYAKGGPGYVHGVGKPKNLSDNSQDTNNTMGVDGGAGIGWHDNSFGLRAGYTRYIIHTPVSSPDIDIANKLELSALYYFG